MEKGGRVPLLIEGDDGTRMDRRAIVNALRVGMREQVGGQPAFGRRDAARLTTLRKRWRSGATRRGRGWQAAPI